MMQAVLQQATLSEYEGGRDAAGLCHGQGRAVFTSGQVYEGQWQSGHMSGGASTIHFPDGISYTGSFEADAISGSGTYCWRDATYEGEVSEGLRHGYGRLTMANSPVVYEGQWQHSKRCGRGVLYYNADRTAYYDGDWLDDMKHGQGTSVYPSGNTYSGSWVQDQRQGQGSMDWVTKAQRYTGHWAQGLPDGFGEHIWQQQRATPGVLESNHAMHVRHNRYVGMFKAGQRHGEGTLYYSSGARYEGQWQQGKKHGQGVYVFEDGHVFSGHFLDDRAVLATGAVLGAASTFAGQGGPSMPCSTSSPQQQHQFSTEPTATLEELQRGSSSSGMQDVPAPATGDAMPASAGLQEAPKAAAVQQGARTGKEPGAKGVGTASKAKPASAASKASLAKSSKAVTEQRSTTAAARASTAGTTSSAARAAAAAAKADNTAGTPCSTSSGPCFGPATCVMQLYIADLLQCYEGQPDAVYKPVSNLLVGYNTELRLLYNKYSGYPSPLLDVGSQGHSWALQACQLWELLRDAQLLCRHVSLQQVCGMVGQATAPPPAVLQYRQQVEPSEAALPSPSAAAATQLLFRDFCEVLVRVAAARYPLLPSLDAQLQQVINHHLLPLLGASARQLAGSSRASVIAASGAAAALHSEASAGPEQQLRSPEVAHYLQEHSALLCQLFAAFGAAGAAGGVPSAVGSASPTTVQLEPEASLAAGACGISQAGDLAACQHSTVMVQQVVAGLQAAGVLQQFGLSAEAAAACMLHNTLAVSDPQGARACIEEAAGEEVPDAAGTNSSTGAAGLGPASSAADNPMQQELLFNMDVPLLLQEALWGLVRLAAALPAVLTPSAQGPSSSTATSGDTKTLQQQPVLGYSGDCSSPLPLLPRLQALLEGPGGAFRAVLGWAPEPVQPTCHEGAPVDAPSSRGCDVSGEQGAEQEGLDWEQEDAGEGEEEEGGVGVPDGVDASSITGGDSDVGAEGHVVE